MVTRLYNKKLVFNTAVNRILQFVNEATKDEYNEGYNWYYNAHLFASELAKATNVTPLVSAGIIAALSPQTDWEQNKKLSVQFLNGEKLNGVPAARVAKCKDILKANTIEQVNSILSPSLRWLKTISFFENILNPKEFNRVTIDRHAIAIVMQTVKSVEPIHVNNAPSVNQYKFIEAAYITAANKYGVTAKQIQAITWLVYRRLRALREHKEVKIF